MSPASLVADGVHVVLSSRSHHLILAGSLSAPSANKNLSSVTTTLSLLAGKAESAVLIWSAVPVKVH